MTTETLATGSESTFLYRFLVSPDLRWMRYLVLILVLGTISFNQVFIIFLDYKDILGGWIYTCKRDSFFAFDFGALRNRI